MTTKRCGVKNDRHNVKKQIFKHYKANRVDDDGREMNLGIVFHICFKKYKVTDIEADVAFTIDQINKDFNKNCSNFDSGRNVYKNTQFKDLYDKYVSVATKGNIKFNSAKIIYSPKDPQDDGIEELDANIKIASPPFEPKKYLNVWIVEFKEDSNGLLGYATFPWQFDTKYDGVLINKGTFGRNPTLPAFNLGKTLTHEMGHYYGLYHSFQETFEYDGGNIDYSDSNDPQEFKGDCVIDTPPQGEPTSGNPYKKPANWPQSKPFDEKTTFRHMFMNYMDYSDDVCLFMFTKDQIYKMRQFIYIYRPETIGLTGPINDTPTVKTIAYGFENLSNPDWIGSPLFINAGLMGTDVQTSKLYPKSGQKSLRAKRNGRIELTANLSGYQNFQLFVYVKAINLSTYIWVLPPGTTTWMSAKFPTNQDYIQYKMQLPGPFNSVNGQHYKIRLGTESLNSIFSYFDDIVITNDPNVNQKRDQNPVEIHF